MYRWVPQTPPEGGPPSRKKVVGLTTPRQRPSKKCEDIGASLLPLAKVELSFREALAQVEVCHFREIQQIRALDRHINLASSPLSSKRDPCESYMDVTIQKRKSQDACCSSMTSARLCNASPHLDTDLFGPVVKLNCNSSSLTPLASPHEVSSKLCFDVNGSSAGDVSQPQGAQHEVPQLDIPWIKDSVARKWAEMSWAITDDDLQCSLNSAWAQSLDSICMNTTDARSAARLSTHSVTSSDLAPCPSLQATGGMRMRLNTSQTFFFSSPSSACRMLHPTGKIRLTWDTCGLVLCLFELIFLPLLIASLIEPDARFAVTNCVYWTVDIFVQFVTGYFTDYGLLEVRFRKIASRYCKRWFLVDLMLAFLDWLILALGEAWAYGKMMKSAARFVRIARLLRILRLASKMQDQLGRVTSQVAFTFLRLMSYMLVVLLLNHYIACAWCATWSNGAYGGDGDFSPTKYAIALHWSFSHCFLSSMDIHPSNFEDRVFTCAVLIVSLAVFSIILSMITNDALALRSVSAERNAKNLILMNFFSEHRLPTDLTCRVWRFVLQHKLFDGKAQQHEKSKEALSLLPAHVQQEIRHEWFSPVLRSHPFFAQYHEMEPLGMRLLCNSAVQVLTLLPQEEMIWPTEHLEQMVFVEKGYLEYHPQGITIAANMWACEEAIWGSAASLPGRMLAGLDTCTLLLIGFKEFKDVVHYHKKSLQYIKRYALAFVNEFNKACVRFTGDEILFNDYDTIASLVNEVTHSSDNIFCRIVSDSRTVS